jgi:tetratricopeptide (TPR) repeat protein
VEAEQKFRDLIAHEERSPTIEGRYLTDARERLRHILEVELRFEERRPLLEGMVGRGEADHFETIAYCFPTHLRWNGPDAVRWLEEFYACTPHDRHLRIALGRYRMGTGQLEEARQILRPTIDEYPADLSAQAAWIALLRESGDIDDADQAIGALPPLAANEPWLLLLQRSGYAIERGDAESAAKALSQLLKSDRTNTEAWQKVAAVAGMQANQQKRTRALTIAQGLSRIQNHIGKGIQRPQDPQSFLDIAEICIEIEFNREELILAQYASRVSPDHPKVTAMLEHLKSQPASVNAELVP